MLLSFISFLNSLTHYPPPMTDLNVLLSSISLTTESLLYPHPFPYSALLLLALKDPNHRLSYNRLNLITSIIPNFSQEFSKKTRDKAKFPSFISTRNSRKIKIFCIWTLTSIIAAFIWEYISKRIHFASWNKIERETEEERGGKGE